MSSNISFVGFAQQLTQLNHGFDSSSEIMYNQNIHMENVQITTVKHLDDISLITLIYDHKSCDKKLNECEPSICWFRFLFDKS